MSLEGFDVCDKCSGYILVGVYARLRRNAGYRCKCDDALTDQVERELKFTIEIEDNRRKAA